MANSNSNHENCKFVCSQQVAKTWAYNAKYDSFTITGGTPGFEGDGNWDEVSQTYFTMDINELKNLAPHIAAGAIKAGLDDCQFTTAYGDLIALGRNLNIMLPYPIVQVAVWDGEWIMD